MMKNEKQSETKQSLSVFVHVSDVAWWPAYLSVSLESQDFPVIMVVQKDWIAVVQKHGDAVSKRKFHGQWLNVVII